MAIHNLLALQQPVKDFLQSVSGNINVTWNRNRAYMNKHKMLIAWTHQGMLHRVDYQTHMAQKDGWHAKQENMQIRLTFKWG